MVHTLCGGYGTARLYDRIDWDAVGEPRIVCGFSDITALHLALAAHAGWVTFYGPNFVRFTRRKDELTKETEEWFHRAFQPEPLGRVFEDPEDPYVLTVGDGVAEAPLVGGCLTLLCASIGTPFEVQTDGCVLMVEDLNTEAYLIDTALNHLIRAGKLDNAAGFVFGTDVNLKDADAAREAGVDALDRGDARRADRAARDPRDRQRARAGTASTWRRCRSASRCASTAAPRPSRCWRRRSGRTDNEEETRMRLEEHVDGTCCRERGRGG